MLCNIFIIFSGCTAPVGPGLGYYGFVVSGKTHGTAACTSELCNILVETTSYWQLVGNVPHLNSSHKVYYNVVFHSFCTNT